METDADELKSACPSRERHERERELCTVPKEVLQLAAQEHCINVNKSIVNCEIRTMSVEKLKTHTMCKWNGSTHLDLE